MAIPWPIAVLPSRSRLRRLSPIAAVVPGAESVRSRAAASRTPSRSPGSTSMTMRSAVSSWLKGIVCASLGAVGQTEVWIGRSAELAVAHGAVAAMMIDQFFLVLHQQPVEFVGEQVDRGIHVRGRRVGMQGAAGNEDVGLGFVV